MIKKVSILTIIILSLSLSCVKKEKKDLITEEKRLPDSVFYYFKKLKTTPSAKAKLSLNDKLFSILKENKSPDGITELINVSENYKSLGENEKFIESLEFVKKNSIYSKDTLSLSKYYNIKANYFIDNVYNDSAYVYLIKAEKNLIKIKDSTLLSKNYLDKAYVQLSIGDFSGCEQSSILSLRYLKANGVQEQYFAYNYIGISSSELKDYNNSINYHKKAYDIANKLNLKSSFHHKSVSLNNIGVVYQNQKNHQEAIKNFQLALEEKKLKQDNPELYTKLLDNLAYSKFEENKLSEAYKLYWKSYKITDSLNLPTGIVNKIHLSEYYLKINDTIKSLAFAQKALIQSKSINSKADILASLKQLSLIDKNKSSVYYDEYIKISDSLQDTERKSKDKFARIAFETDEIIQQKDILEDKNRSLLYTFIGVLFLLSLLFVVRAQRARTKELMFKQAQQRANEEIYNLLMAQQDIIDQSREIEKRKIARDLHDGILSRMFGARLNLDSINHLEDPESVKKRLEHLNELKEIEQDIREISHDLSREKQDLINNFVSITTNLFEEQSLTHPAKLTYFMDSSIKWDLVKNNIKINVFRILQESLQNINKYAKANNIHVEFRKENSELYITVTDDGIGFDIAKKSKGIGMQNMISRAIDCNGKLDISSNKENGTKITLTIPLE